MQQQLQPSSWHSIFYGILLLYKEEKKQQKAISMFFKYPHWHIPGKHTSLQLTLIKIYNIEEIKKYIDAQIKIESEYPY